MPYVSGSGRFPDIADDTLQLHLALGQLVGDRGDGELAARDLVGDDHRALHEQARGLHHVPASSSSTLPSPSRRAARIEGVTRSTTLRMKPPGTSPPSRASTVALTAPQLSWPSTTINGTFSTWTPYSMEPSTELSMTWPAVRTTNMSPRPWSKISSPATRESPQPNRMALGCWPEASLARSAMPWLGCSTLPLTNRSLPSRRDFQALIGFVGMTLILHGRRPT